MATINLKDFYPWYTHDEFVQVPDVIAAELFTDRRYQKSHEQRIRRNKAFYSLDAQDGIETSAVGLSTNNPEDVLEMTERHCRLCCALNSLPDTQGRRIDAHYLLGKSRKEIAEAEGVSESAISESISRGLKAMRKIFFKNFSNLPCQKLQK